jgi:hypothetical protein
MKLMIRTAEYNLLGYGRNESILEELKVEPVKQKLSQHKYV